MFILAQEDGGAGASEAFADVSLELSDWLTAAGVIVGAVVIALVVRMVIVRLAGGGDSDYAARIIGRFVTYLVVIAGIVYALTTLGVNLAPILGLLGVAGLALAIAFQDILGNFLAGVLLLLRRPFVPGDQIETNGHAGTVEDVNLRTVVLRTFAGEQIYVPNGEVLANPIINLTEREVRRTTLPVGVDYAADLDSTQQLIEETVAAQEGVLADPAVQAFVHEFGDNSINFAVRFWHEAPIAEEWSVRDRVARALKRALDEAGVNLPFPQRTLRIAADSEPIRVAQS